MANSKKFNALSVRAMMATLSLTMLATTLAGCAVYAPPPHRVAYVASAPVVVVHPYRERIIVR